MIRRWLLGPAIRRHLWLMRVLGFSQDDIRDEYERLMALPLEAE